MDRRRARCPHAFTLVELLLCLGLILAMLGLLLPAVAKTQELARRTQCLSNLRQLHQAFVQYAMANHDLVPLGYRAQPVPSKQFNSMIYSSTTGAYTLLGWMYEEHLLTQPRVLYCPSENDPREQLATPANPFPASPDVMPTSNVYAGYGCRPVVALPDRPTANAMLPHLSQFKSQAILADLVSTAARVDSRHRTGVNVLRGDGSAGWVRRATFDTPLAQCGNPFPPTSAFNGFQDQLWSQLDR